MAHPFRPDPDQPDPDPGQPGDPLAAPPPAPLPQVPVTVSFRPDLTMRWIATAVEGALSLGLPDPIGCTFTLDPDTRAPEILLTIDGTSPRAWDHLTAWADRHDAEVIAAPAPERPDHWYAAAVFSRNFMIWTVAAYIPTSDGHPAAD